MENAIKKMEAFMTPESVNRARIKAEQELLTIKLAQLREKSDMTQQEVKKFSQSSVSRLEKRKDIKISTLVEYLDSLGMGVEIKAYSKTKNSKFQEHILLKV